MGHRYRDRGTCARVTADLADDRRPDRRPDRPAEIVACMDKVRHANETLALEAAAAATLARGRTLRVYACLWCGGWHLTHRAEAWRDRPDQIERAAVFAAVAQEMLAAAGEAPWVIAKSVGGAPMPRAPMIGAQVKGWNLR